MRAEVMSAVLQFLYTAQVQIEAEWCVELLEHANKLRIYKQYPSSL